ncbi:hypothetical protein [Parafrankia elaeagni]|uniref:hypothetical protein n=1 Tax=Parafrankia elaeagni TaxID=222534 RepID=UPI00036DEBCC|nr:hypothetical protein [Parafrankia elaeagni]
MNPRASAGFERLRPRGTAGGIRSASGRDTGRARADGAASGTGLGGTGRGGAGIPVARPVPLRERVVEMPATDSAHGRGGSIGRDAHGKRALYSGVRPPGNRRPTLAIACSRCGRSSVVGLWRAFLVLTPSMHLPLPLRHPSLLRCPACGRPSWVRLALRTRP